MQTIATFLIAVTLVHLFLTAFIYFKNRELEINRSFAAVMLSYAVWTLGYAEMFIHASSEVAPWANLSFLGTILIGSASLHLSWIFPRRTKYSTLSNKWTLWSATCASLLVSALFGPPVESFSMAHPTSLVVNYLLFAGLTTYSVLLQLALLVVLLRTSRSLSGTSAIQARLIRMGFLVTIICSTLFDVILPACHIFGLLWLGPLSSLFLAAIVVYAVVAHQLFDIRFFVSRAVGYSVLLGVLITFFMLFLFSLTQIFNVGAISKSDLLPNLVAALLIGFGFDPLRRWLQNKTDTFLFKKEYDQQEVLRDLSHKLNNVIGLDEALGSVMQSIMHSLRIKRAATFVFQPTPDKEGLAVKHVKAIGPEAKQPIHLGEKDAVIDYFKENSGVFIVEDAKHEMANLERQLHSRRVRKTAAAHATAMRTHGTLELVLKRLASFEIEAAIPLQLKDQFIGLILLGEKLSQDDFSTKDVTLMEMIGVQAVSSIQKAKLYEGDQMKSEFVSIASHELLTPISAMEGYLSMILDDNLGHVDTKARDYLNKVYASAKRLSLLIKDLLSVSRIEAGRMKIEPQALDAQKLITDTLDQLKFIAEDKKLTLTYSAPKEALPLVWADPDRTMQILVNLVSNAIKYTFEGSVTVSAHKRPGSIAIEVSDTGIGIKKKDQAHLFEKFYRVDSPQTTGIIGTGLGLYITKSVLEKMGGTISMKSTAGEGSCFTITLPIYVPAPKKAASSK